MATLRTTAGLPAPAPPRRRGRWWPALVLAAVVLGGHAWLARLLVPEAPRAGAPRPALVQLRNLAGQGPAVVPGVVPGALPVAEAVALVAGPPTMPSLSAPATPRQRRRGALPAEPPPPPPPPAAAAAAPLAGDPAPASATTGAVTAGLATAGPTTTALPPSPAAGAADGAPPPLYATRLPPPVQLRYALQYNGRSGEALLVWQHDGRRYRLTLDGTGADGRPLLAQASDGALDVHGLAPERFVDRRRTGRQQAANFRRDTGRIAYSGPPHEHPAWPGAQDRLSWLAQLVAALGAADTAAADLRFFVADAQGHAGLWQLQRQADAPGPTPWGEQLLQHWQREPPRPEGLRIDVWLVAQPATPAGAWPVRLRFAVPRSGDAFELNLLATP